jgi:shikimate kinase
MILKLKRTPGIYLVGFMGCGKSVVGIELAARLGWVFCDIDSEIEAEQGVTISSIFETRGEEAFRTMETETIRRRVRMIQSGEPAVVALGGGAFTRQQNCDLLENNGITIWLDCPLPLIKKRIEGSTHRPLARDPNKFDLLYWTRRESYAHADYRIDISSDNPSDAVTAILALPLF